MRDILKRKMNLFKFQIEAYNQWGAEHANRLQEIENMQPEDKPEGVDELLGLQVRGNAFMMHVCMGKCGFIGCRTNGCREQRRLPRRVHVGEELII